MIKFPLIAPIEYWAHSADSFYAYVKQLMNSNISKEVAGVSISIRGDNSMTIRISRDTKTITRNELTLLAKEYKQNEMELLALFKKRKIGIIYDDDTIRESDDRFFKEAKENARAEATRKRKEARLNKLQQLERNTRLHEESSIQFVEEST